MPSLPLSSASCSALYYVKVMKKVLDKGVEYIQTEHERLGRILSTFPNSGWIYMYMYTCILQWWGRLVHCPLSNKKHPPHFYACTLHVCTCLCVINQGKACYFVTTRWTSILCWWQGLRASTVWCVFYLEP